MRHAKIVFSLPALLLAAAIATGCVREKMEDCDTTIVFSYLGDGTAEIFGRHVEHVDLYVFDDQHRVVREHIHPTAAELAAREMRMYLPTGRRYHLVAVGNVDQCTIHELHDGASIDSKVMHPGHDHFDNDVDCIDSHAHLYMGDTYMDIPLRAGSRHMVDFRSSHADMHVEVVGYNEFATRQGSGGLRLEHHGLPGWTDFSNNCSMPEHEWIAQRPAARVQGRSHIHEYNVMRDLKGSVIRLSDSSGELFSLDVDKYIHDHLMPNSSIAGPYNSRGELLQEVLVPIRIEFRALGVEVTIPEWALTNAKPEF